MKLIFDLKVHTAEEIYTMELGTDYVKAVAAMNRIKSEGQVTISEKGLKGTEILKIVPYHAISLFEIIVAEARIK